MIIQGSSSAPQNAFHQSAFNRTSLGRGIHQDMAHSLRPPPTWPMGRGFPVSLPSYPTSALWTNYRAALESPYSVSFKKCFHLYIKYLLQVYLAHLQGSLSDQNLPTLPLLGSSPPFSGYHQLAAAHRLASIQRTLIAETGDSVGAQSTEQVKITSQS